MTSWRKHQHESSINLLFKVHLFVKVLFAGVFAGSALVDAPHQPVEEPRIPLDATTSPFVASEDLSPYPKTLWESKVILKLFTKFQAGHKCLAIECRVFDEPAGSCIKKSFTKKRVKSIMFQCALISLLLACCMLMICWLNGSSSVLYLEWCHDMDGKKSHTNLKKNRTHYWCIFVASTHCSLLIVNPRMSNASLLNYE